MLIRKSVSKIGHRLSTDAFSSGIFLDGDLFVELLSLSLWGIFFSSGRTALLPRMTLRSAEEMPHLPL